MGPGNDTRVTEFILVGFTGSYGARIAFFMILLFSYFTMLVCNVAMIVVISVDRRLHTPMYFFLWNLSLLETLNITNVIPLMLRLTFSLHPSISTAGCFIQSFLYYYLITNVFCFLPIMSYDRYVAICNPLRYTAIMSGLLCVQLVIGSWLGSLLPLLYGFILTTRLPFCGPNIIDNFYCDLVAILRLACTDTTTLQIINLNSAFIVLIVSLGLTIVSYIFVISSVLRIPSANGRRKAFSTCSSHLIMVAIIYGCALFITVSPVLRLSAEVYKMVNIVSSFISPLMNPFVYTFRNEKVKEVLKSYLC
ncbi:olfactory receptor 6M1-like [Ambystoma mexicanum]|uniref:olfactory receptor 6M1-like n=1 Tax=Ambystoma mexicanum TaxID=8296 RepID=UPI0037E8EB54